MIEDADFRLGLADEDDIDRAFCFLEPFLVFFSPAVFLFLDDPMLVFSLC